MSPEQFPQTIGLQTVVALRQATPPEVGTGEAMEMQGPLTLQ